MLSCLHTNIRSKHSSWEPAGGEFKHYYRRGFIACLWTEAISLIISRVTKPDCNGIWSDRGLFMLLAYSGLLDLFAVSTTLDIIRV